jgi:hypothetical protein
MTEKEALKTRLLSYLDIKAERKQIEREIARLADPKGTNWDGMPRGSGGGDVMAGIVAKRDALRRKYEAKLADLIAAQTEIEETIDGLDPRERRLMRLRYIDGLEWEEVCVKICYSWRQTHRLHSEILDKLLTITEGGTPN